MKKAASVITAAAFMLTMCVSVLPAKVAAQEVTYDAGYVGLGDSIARGYGTYKGESAVDMIGSLLLDKAHAKNAVARYDNLAQDGDRSYDLLAKLKNSPEVIDAVKDSKAVTISIGGNNIMWEMARQVAIALGINPDTDPDYLTHITEELQNNPVSSAAKITVYCNSSAFKDAMDAKIQEFRADMVQIPKEIKKINSTSKIIVQTLYCPTKFVILSSFIDTYIKKLNDVIVELAPGNYTVVDIHKAFKDYSGSEQLTFTAVMDGIFDPHPTPAGQKLIFDNLLPEVQFMIDNLPARTKTPVYKANGNLLYDKKYAFDFDSAAFTSGTSIFEPNNTAANYVQVTAGGYPNAYDFRIVPTNHIRGLEFTMLQDYDCAPIELKLNSAVNGTSFLSGRKVIPADSEDHGLLFYVDTTQYTGARHMLLQFQEVDFKGNVTRRGLKANAEAYCQDSNNNFTVPVEINSNYYLILPQNYQGYLAIPFNSFYTIWGTNDMNFAVDLKDVQSINIYRASNAGGGKLVLDEFCFYGKTLTGNAMTPAQGQTKTQGMPENLIPLFNFEDNRFVADRSLFESAEYLKRVEKYLNPPARNNPPQYNLNIVSNSGVPGANTTKGMQFETLPTQSSSGQYMGISLLSRQELGTYEKVMKKGNLVSSSSESDGVAFYIDLTSYTSSTVFSLNPVWHETDCDADGLPAYTSNSDGTNVENLTSRHLKPDYGAVEGVLDDGTSVTLPVSGNNVQFPTLPNGQRFKGWVKLPFAAFETCWNSNDVNEAVDYNDFYGFDLAFGSYPTMTGPIVFDEFSFYGPTFAQLHQKLTAYTPQADLLDMELTAGGTAFDKTGKSTLSKIGNVSVGNTTVTHNGQSYTVPGMTVSASGQGMIATYSSITNKAAQEDTYKYGFTVEAFGVNRAPSGEQAFLSNCQAGGYGLFSEGGKTKFDVYAGGYVSAFSQNDLPANDIVHIMAAYDFANKRLSVYINGALSRIADIPGNYSGPTGDAYNKVGIGGDTDTYGQLTQSLMTNFTLVDAKLYSKPLNGLQAKAAYSNALQALS